MLFIPWIYNVKVPKAWFWDLSFIIVDNNSTATLQKIKKQLVVMGTKNP